VVVCIKGGEEMKIKYLSFSVIPLLVIIIFVIWFGIQNQDAERTPRLYLIPEGVTHIEIHYNQEGYAKLTKEGNYIFYNIPKTGVLKTSTNEPEYGIAPDKFYYIDDDGKRTAISGETINSGIGSEEGKQIIHTIIIEKD